jgi:hypothetical protein
MDTSANPSLMKRFRVKVGHAQVTVYAADEAQARQEARRLLSQEMPRLWDVIYQCDAQKFSIEEIP